jgi:hypothetical protein
VLGLGLGAWLGLGLGSGLGKKQKCLERTDCERKVVRRGEKRRCCCYLAFYGLQQSRLELTSSRENVLHFKPMTPGKQIIFSLGRAICQKKNCFRHLLFVFFCLSVLLVFVSLLVLGVFVLSHLVLPCVVLWCLVLSCGVLSCLTLSCLHLVLSCLILCCLPCVVVSCLVFSCRLCWYGKPKFAKVLV